MKFSIEQARIYRGISQDEMAAKIGIHPNTYCRKEHNPYTFRMGEMKKFLAAVQMKMSDLIYFD